MKLKLLNGAVLAVFLCLGPSTIAKSFKEATPRDCYTSYNQALYYAKDIQALVPYFTRTRQQLLRSLDKGSQLNEYKSFRTWYISDPKFVGEKIDGTTAHLTIKGTAAAGTKTYPATLTIDLKRENNYWRVDAGSITGVVQLN